MPTEITLLKVLISMPSDLKTEREVVRGEVEELNQSVLARKNIRLEVVSWETHVAPDFGQDPQAVINRQLPEWDIYVGMLGCRFGTPTGRAASGTEEEFSKAYSRWKSDNRSCRICFYFSTALRSPDEIEPSQLALVKQFRATLGPLGGLYFTYSDPSTELPRLVRRHLTSAVDDYGVTWGPNRVEAATLSPLPPPLFPEDEDADGPLDLAVDAEEAMEKLFACIGRITAAIQQSGSELEIRTRQIDNLKKAGQLTPKRIRSIAADSARGISMMGARIDVELPQFRNTWSTLREKMLLILPAVSSKTPDEVQSWRELAKQVGDGSETLENSLATGFEFRDTLNWLGSFSRDLRTATRQAGLSLASFFSEVRVVVAGLNELQRGILERIDQSASGSPSK